MGEFPHREYLLFDMYSILFYVLTKIIVLSLLLYISKHEDIHVVYLSVFLFSKIV
jgi:hypothetical protein